MNDEEDTTTSEGCQKIKSKLMDAIDDARDPSLLIHAFKWVSNLLRNVHAHWRLWSLTRFVPDFAVANPIVGSLCAMACRVLMEEARVRKARAFSLGAWGETVMRGEMPPPGAEAVALGNDLHAGMETMGVYAVECPLIRECCFAAGPSSLRR
ncbi:hypothetical protein R3P38DRAFT_3228490 [Favolaschia claudopus]|uniref:Uncharacterized protein n=1 Tax=Favolaschia claudopus TaxID=2862362 RepID=A0AAV9ZPT1_9AGAR